MWQFLLGLIAGFALGWWLDWYLSRQETHSLREEVTQKNETIAKLQKDLLAQPPAKAQAPKREKPLPPPHSAEPEEPVTAYCVKCKAHRSIESAQRVALSNGRPALKGTCPVCHSGLFRIVKLL
jgi:hypothetical protein